MSMKPFKVKDGGVFACDVDDTLLMWSIPQGYSGPLVKTKLNGIEEEHRPNLPAIEHLKKMKARGYAVIVWSAGGSDWAEEAVRALNLQDFVDVIMPKIDFHLDDVDDPKDKIGKWQYITPEGRIWKKDHEGKIIEIKVENR